MKEALKRLWRQPSSDRGGSCGVCLSPEADALVGSSHHTTLQHSDEDNTWGFPVKVMVGRHEGRMGVVVG